MFEITLVWGLDEGSKEVNYTFETEAELVAFKLALAEIEANGSWNLLEEDLPEGEQETNVTGSPKEVPEEVAEPEQAV